MLYDSTNPGAPGDGVRETPSVRTVDGVRSPIETIELREETVQRLDGLRIEDESYDEFVTEHINIYEAEELTLFHSGDG